MLKFRITKPRGSLDLCIPWATPTSPTLDHIRTWACNTEPAGGEAGEELETKITSHCPSHTWDSWVHQEKPLGTEKGSCDLLWLEGPQGPSDLSPSSAPETYETLPSPQNVPEHSVAWRVPR